VTITFAVNVLRRWPRASESEISDLEPTLEIDEDVGGLEVEMNVS
jgi:hypothetical protein